MATKRPPGLIYDEADIDAVTRTMLGEAANQGDDGLAAVAHVIVNRLEKGGYGKTLNDVARAPKQFSAWNSKGLGGNNLVNISADDPRYQRARAIAEEVLNGRRADNTGGAVNYFAPAGMTGKNGTVKGEPKWASQMSYTTTIGGHKFYSDGAVGAADRLANGTSVSDIQQQLAQRGFNPGPIDGIRGPQTTAAIKAFQKANGLAVDGIVGPKTLAALQSQQRPTTQREGPPSVPGSLLDFNNMPPRASYWQEAGKPPSTTTQYTVADTRAEQRRPGTPLASRSVSTVPVDMNGNPIVGSSSGPGFVADTSRMTRGEQRLGARPAFTVGTQPALTATMPPGARPSNIPVPSLSPAPPMQAVWDPFNPNIDKDQARLAPGDPRLAFIPEGQNAAGLGAVAGMGAVAGGANGVAPPNPNMPRYVPPALPRVGPTSPVVPPSPGGFNLGAVLGGLGSNIQGGLTNAGQALTTTASNAIEGTRNAIGTTAQNAGDLLKSELMGTVKGRTLLFNTALGLPAPGSRNPTRYGNTFAERQENARRREAMAYGLPYVPPQTGVRTSLSLRPSSPLPTVPAPRSNRPAPRNTGRWEGVLDEFGMIL